MESTEKIRILIVEDNPDMLDIYAGMFKHESRFEIEMESDAMKALRRLEDTKYDLIILDIIMEPLTGESFFVYLRGNVKTMRLPVIVVSVLEPHTLDALKKLNHSMILQKPVSKADLFASIDKMIALGKKAGDL
jgi:DNA-binding response OmpR family regulator